MAVKKRVTRKKATTKRKPAVKRKVAKKKAGGTSKRKPAAKKKGSQEAGCQEEDRKEESGHETEVGDQIESSPEEVTSVSDRPRERCLSLYETDGAACEPPLSSSTQAYHDRGSRAGDFQRTISVQTPPDNFS